jgi:hypothetical protein
MSYEVRCECEKAYPIGAADAGVSFRCTCGKRVDVPALHVLRASAGEKTLIPLMQIQSGFMSGELPGPPICACCGRDTTRQISVSVVCERGTSGAPAVASQVASGCFTVGLMILTGIFVFSRDVVGPSGRDSSGLSVTVPIFVCEECDGSVTTVSAIRKALDVTPAYSALLERYPDAEIRRVA